MEHTGERFAPGQQGNIELEHLHRYISAGSLCVGKDVLEIGVGDGYGASILARIARNVTGLDLSVDAIHSAQQTYGSERLEFRTGSALGIPLETASVDVVVSLNATGWREAPEAMMAEIKRVLRSDGVLVMSYSDGCNAPEAQFEAFAKAHFAHVSLHGPRIGRQQDLGDPTHLIAVASDSSAPSKLASGAFDWSARDLAPRHELASDVTSARLKEDDETLVALRVQLTDSLARVTRLEAEEKELRAALTNVGASAARLSAAVESYRSSFSWRITAPLRVTLRLLRRAKRLAAVPYRIVRGASTASYTPVKDLQRTTNGFVSTGDDPQFSVAAGWSGIRPGWALIELEIESGQMPLSPVVYAFAGDNGEQVFSFPITGYVKGLERRLIVLPAGVRSLRFDPVDRSDVHFAIKRLNVRSISKLGLVREGYTSLDSEQRGLLIKETLRGNLHAVKSLVRGGVVGKYDKGEYRAWVELYDTLTPDDIVRIRELGDALAQKPLISVLMPVYNPRPKYLRKALDSVLAQTYPNWELCIADDASTNPEVRTVLEEYMAKDGRIKVTFREKNGHISASSNSALELVTGEFIALMDHDDAIPAHALFAVAEEINTHPQVDMIYTDEDKIDEDDNRHDPYFKSDWNQELFYSQNFVAHMGIYRASIVKKIKGFRIGFEGSQDYDFVLRFLLHTQASRIRHIPHVLYHWRIFPGVTSFSTDNPDKSVNTAHRALVEYFEQAEPGAEVVPIEQFPSWWRVKRQAPARPPRVSLIVPTRDRLDVLQVAISGLLNETEYESLEVVIVDNESVERETLEYFELIKQDPRVKVLRVEGAFNFSKLNNLAAKIATGSLLGFVNNDIKVIHPGWLTELVTQASQRNVGAVGAKLYYANDTIQHAGVVLGLYGVAAHGHRHFPRNSVGYFGRPMLVQNVSAVTAACMLVPKHVFDEVGGYNEKNLSVGYNDVDLCLKIREAGYDIVFTPFAELYHLESVSRGENLSPAQIERDARERTYMLSRWGGEIAHDPFYSPNLTLNSEDYRLAFPPRAPKSWKTP
ncbi:glycosyltransferase [Paraburkholderia largidicola]|uniref:Glycosyl transferase family 2 n=1 Tax=Paraburkholderia largidicola TaxID=3014751 RepID=A0A7I8BKY9_9BURK|nr:glycosyltransferase [Paraburkholderia sp. PGU16]BCF89416.1 hypothetical protein PPGU16_24830 [Paraburkholderia sp. PGU16]